MRLILLAVVAASFAPVSAQTIQKISPVVECIGQKADGTYYAWYGYFNRNDETVATPTGSGSDYANRFTAGGDLGQPTSFLPGRQQHVFRIEHDGSGTTWILKAQGSGRQATATAGTRLSATCLYDRGGADLALTASVSDPAPEVGEVVTAVVTLRNDGPAAVTGVAVDALSQPAGVTIVGVSTSAGTFAGTRWVLDLDADASATLTVQVRIDQAVAVSVPFEVAASDPPDPDSTPGNGDAAEDDYALAAFSPTASSGGNDGGLESDGSLATLLARREVSRSLARAETARLGQAPALVRLDAAQARTARGAELDLRALLPTTGPGATTAYVTTPEDLLQITNARAILAADYFQEDGDRAAVALAVLTPAGETYDHTKAICDRVKGSRLESVRTVGVAGGEFVLLHVSRPDGRVDYAVSFVAYPQDGGYTIDSRFRAEEYAITEGEAGEVLNVQAWAATPDAALSLVEAMLNAFEAQVDAGYRNAGQDAPALPSVFVRGGEYVPGRLVLDVANTTGQPQTIRLDGTTTDAEEGARAAFERTLTVPPAGFRTEIETGALFDAGFSVVAGGAVTDFVYLADGVWTYTSGDASDVLDYTVEAGGLKAGFNQRPVERDARLAGTTGTWAGLFRSLHPGSRPADLSDFSALAFQARGTGRVQVVVEKTSTNGVEPFHAWIELTDDLQTVTLPFSELRRAAGQGGFTAEDVTLVAFYTYDDGGQPDVFEIDVRNVRFENSQSVSAEDGAEAELGLSVAPNPSRGDVRIRVELPAASDVSVEVYDLLGRRVATLAQGARSAGVHMLDLPASVAAGTYLVRLQAGRELRVQRITRLP